jgi:hypothetical protein
LARQVGGQAPQPGPSIKMSSRLPSGTPGKDELADLWYKVEKRCLKRVAADLKQCLNGRAAAIKRRARGASPMASEAASVSTLPGSTTLEAVTIGLQLHEVAFEVAAVGQQPSTGEANSSPQPLCFTVRGVASSHATWHAQAPTAPVEPSKQASKGCAPPTLPW